MNKPEPLLTLAAIALAAALSLSITSAIRPLLQRYALARPNARSSHRIPTPQGAGIAVIAATLSVMGIFTGLAHLPIPALVFGGTLFVALIGLIDDIKSLSVLPRLILQALAIGAVVLTAPPEFRIASGIPVALERSLLVFAGLWFVNLVNFMDGLDLMTVSEILPITVAMVLLGWFGEYPAGATIVAAALCGAMLGFAPYNRPVAKVFLGDVGSLPIGLLLGWALLQLASQHFAAAVLLPLYYLGDATLTLIRRVARSEPFWAAHRTHFYQRATDNGFTVPAIIGEVLLLNVVLAALAALSVVAGSVIADIALLVIGSFAVLIVLFHFSRKPSTQNSPAAG